MFVEGDVMQLQGAQARQLRQDLCEEVRGEGRLGNGGVFVFWGAARGALQDEMADIRPHMWGVLQELQELVELACDRHMPKEVYAATREPRLAHQRGCAQSLSVVV